MLVVRVLGTMAILLVLSVIVFSMMHFAPGDIVKNLLGNRPSTPGAVAVIRAHYNLDKPLYMQYLIWLGNAISGDFGQSIRMQDSVSNVIGSRLPITAALTGVAFAMSVLVAIPMGVRSAVRSGSWIDRLATGFGIVGLSAPTFAVGLVLLYVFAFYVPIFPVYGGGDGGLDTLYHLILPGVTLALGLGAIILKLTRTAMLRELESDYVTFGRARGLPERQVQKIALRNAAIPIITGAGLVLTFLVGGTVLAEATFALPGVGTLLQGSVLFKDIPVVQALTLLVAAAIAMISLLADLAYVLLDPRIRANEVQS